MTDKTDFSKLYHELGVEPDAGIEALQRAYRRCLRRLHPDAGGAQAAAGTVDLSWLVRDYRRALAFHQAHGRLPGSSEHHAPRCPEGLPRASFPTLPAAQSQSSLSSIGTFSRWMQILVVVTMVVIGIGLLLP